MSVRPPVDLLSCTLDRWVNGRAVLRFEDGQELAIPRRYLPKDTPEGTVFLIDIKTEEIATKAREELARAILKEILGGSA